MPNAIDYSNWKEEKIDGKIHYMSPSANPRHSEIILNIATLFKAYLKGKKCKVFMDNIDIHLDETNNNYVVPDMSVLCDPSKFKSSGYHGVPSLIVEVLSPSNIKRDRVDKFNLYERFGVKEYWLVNYKAESIEQYILSNDSYQLYKAFTILDEWDFNNRLTKIEQDAYTTIIRPTIFDDLEVNIRDIFE